MILALAFALLLTGTPKTLRHCRWNEIVGGDAKAGVQCDPNPRSLRSEKSCRAQKNEFGGHLYVWQDGKCYWNPDPCEGEKGGCLVFGK